MKKGFSLLNIIILLSLFSLAFLLYNNYSDNKFIPISIDQASEKKSNTDTISPKTELSSSSSETEIIQKKSSPLPSPDTLPSVSPQTSKPQVTPGNINLPSHNGFYLNEEYNYSINFPASWTLKNQYPDNISIGTIPPKDGQGALSIVAGKGGESEINQIKNEVKKYPGVLELREEKIIIDDIEGEKFILINNIIKSNTVYIILSNNNNDFVIQYGVESDEFSKQVDNVLRDLKFISK